MNKKNNNLKGVSLFILTSKIENKELRTKYC